MLARGDLECVGVSGSFMPGEPLSAADVHATVRGVSRVADVVLTDKASAPLVRYRQGIDYDVNVRSGLLRVREGCSAETVYVSADCEACDARLVEALTASDVTRELLFVGQPDSRDRVWSFSAGRPRFPSAAKWGSFPRSWPPFP